jgi:hypothetical protein
MEQNIRDITNSYAIGNNTSGNNNRSTVDEKLIEINECKVSMTKKSYLPILSIFLSIGAFIISIIAIWICAPRYKDLGFDYTGVIVTVLSLLITILIAWQIYMTLTLDHRAKQYISNELHSTKADIYHDIDTKIKNYDYHLGSILLHTKANNMNNKKNAIKYYFKALYLANKSSYRDNIDHLIDDLTMSMTIFNPDKNDFTKEDIDNFSIILSNSESPKVVGLSIIQLEEICGLLM